MEPIPSAVIYKRCGCRTVSCCCRLGSISNENNVFNTVVRYSEHWSLTGMLVADQPVNYDHQNSPSSDAFPELKTMHSNAIQIVSLVFTTIPPFYIIYDIIGYLLTYGFPIKRIFARFCHLLATSAAHTCAESVNLYFLSKNQTYVETLCVVFGSYFRIDDC